MIDTVLIVLIVAVVVGFLAAFAIIKGRGLKFGLGKGDSKIELGVEEKQPGASGVGPIENVDVLKKGNVVGSNVNIKIGHSVDKEKDKD